MIDWECLLSEEVRVHSSGYVMELMQRFHISRGSNRLLSNQKYERVSPVVFHGADFVEKSF